LPEALIVTAVEEEPETVIPVVGPIGRIAFN
jgi:hypothetical protein